MRREGVTRTMPSRANPHRREWERIQFVGSCPYEMSETIGAESLLIHRGTAISLNCSQGGMLILLDQPPHVSQVLSLRLPLSSEKTSDPTLVEVRWTRKIQVETEDASHDMHLAGVRFLFGPRPLPPQVTATRPS